MSKDKRISAFSLISTPGTPGRGFEFSEGFAERRGSTETLEEEEGEFVVLNTSPEVSIVGLVNQSPLHC